jgi:predicted transcriptional regulator
MNDDSFLPSMLSKLQKKEKFSIAVVEEKMEEGEINCLKLQDGSIYTTLAAATAAALAFIAI